MLSWRELQEVLLDVENTLNNRSLTYVEDHVEYPILTPNALVIGQNLMLPDEILETKDKDLCKRFQNAKKQGGSYGEKNISSFWKYENQRPNVNSGEVVVIQSDDQNKGNCTCSIITDVFPEPDNTVWAVQNETSKAYLQCTVQHLYPIELSCHVDRDGDCRTNRNLHLDNDKMNPEGT